MSPCPLRFSFVLAFVNVLAVAWACVAAPAAEATHLYVSGPNDSPGYEDSGVATTVSYPIVGGHVARHPDRVYPANTQGPMALDAAGDLYAGMGYCGVTVYAPDSTKVMRTLNVGFGPTGCTGYFAYQNMQALAVDERGYLYVAMAWEYDGSAKTPPARPSANALAQANASYDCYTNSCIFVYAPNASGDDAPVKTITMGDASSGIAVDRAGSIYMRGSSDSIIVIAHAATEPQVVRTIVPAGFTGIANPTFADNALYAMVSKCATREFWQCKPGLAMFKAGADGTVAPERYFLEPLDAGWFGYALGGAAVYVGTAGSELQVFDKHGEGEKMPLFWQILSPLPVDPSYIVAGA